MSVALSMGVMRLSEFIIIYLAAAAPFGVANFLRHPADVPRPRSILKAMGAGLLWPLTLLVRSLAEKRFGLRGHDAVTPDASPSRELHIDDARRALLSALYRIEDLARDVSHSQREATLASVHQVIASVERYVGLTLSFAHTGTVLLASPRETELCRIIGRAGDDLLIAGRCYGRRNLARLRAHQAQSRLELLHALAELREVCERTLTNTNDASVTHALCAALFESYARVIDLFSLLEDERAAMTVARLLDAACARLRHIESLYTQVAQEFLVQQGTTGHTAGDEPCQTSIPPTNSQPQLSRTQTIRVHG